jgi:nicotinic acid mononucleotide adenylyltransferase
MNPVHRGHLDLTDIAARYLRRQGLVPICVNLSLSSDRYVKEKNGPEAMSVEYRGRLCSLACEEFNAGEHEVDAFVDLKTDGTYSRQAQASLQIQVDACGALSGTPVLLVWGGDKASRNDRVVNVPRSGFTFAIEADPKALRFVCDEPTRGMVSSTELRRRLKERLPLDDLTFSSVAAAWTGPDWLGSIPEEDLVLRDFSEAEKERALEPTRTRGTQQIFVLQLYDACDRNWEVTERSLASWL